MTLQIGDVVAIKSGSYGMTIIEVREKPNGICYIDVKYMCEQGTIRRDVFPAACLTKDAASFFQRQVTAPTMHVEQMKSVGTVNFKVDDMRVTAENIKHIEKIIDHEHEGNNGNGNNR